MAKKSDLTLFLRARHKTTQHFAGVPTEGSDGWKEREVKRIQKQMSSLGKEEEWRRDV